MPIYEYKCKKCGHVSSFLEKTNQNKQEHICEKCRSNELEKAFSTFSPQSGSSTPSDCPECRGGPSCGCPNL